MARLDQPSGQPEFLAAANPADGSVTVVPAALLTGPQQRSYELWVIPPGGTPHSLGLVDPERPVKVVVPPELLPHVSADSTLAITLEPPGGSPTGKPTGPVIANGKLASLAALSCHAGVSGHPFGPVIEDGIAAGSARP